MGLNSGNPSFHTGFTSNQSIGPMLESIIGGIGGHFPVKPDQRSGNAQIFHYRSIQGSLGA